MQSSWSFVNLKFCTFVIISLFSGIESIKDYNNSQIRNFKVNILKYRLEWTWTNHKNMIMHSGCFLVGFVFACFVCVCLRWYIEVLNGIWIFAQCVVKVVRCYNLVCVQQVSVLFLLHVLVSLLLVPLYDFNSSVSNQQIIKSRYHPLQYQSLN